MPERSPPPPWLLVAATLLGPAVAHAAPSADEQIDVDPVPAAPDQVAGHFLLEAGAGWIWAAGQVGGTPTTSPGPGPGLRGFAGFGVSRQLVLGADGGWASLGAPEGCAGCSADGLDAGLQARFVLMQGQRLSPWVAAGVGYRSLDLTGTPAAVVGTYSGLEWLRLQTGATWYALAGFTMTPQLSLSAFSPSTLPTTAGPAGTLWLGQLTVTVGLDAPGR